MPALSTPLVTTAAFLARLRLLCFRGYAILDGGWDELRERRLFCSRSRLTSSAKACTTVCTSGGVCAHESAQMPSSAGFADLAFIVHYLTINDLPRHHPERIPVD